MILSRMIVKVKRYLEITALPVIVNLFKKRYLENHGEPRLIRTCQFDLKSKKMYHEMNEILHS